MKVIDNTGKEYDHIDVTKLLNIDEDSTSIPGVFEPLICVCFMASGAGALFISTYHRL